MPRNMARKKQMIEEKNAAPEGEEALRTTEEKEADQDATAQLQEELDVLRSRHLRLAADFENYKKRVRQEQEEAHRYAGALLAERMLPVLDDAQLALEHAPEDGDEGWLKGVRLTFQKLEEALATSGVEPVPALETKFDPKLHEAIGTAESPDHPDDTVVMELRRGYRMHDKVLRPALVKVSRKGQ